MLLCMAYGQSLEYVQQKSKKDACLMAHCNETHAYKHG